MTIITATEFKKNLGNYLSSTNNEDILITKNGKVIKKLTSPNNKLDILNEIAGSLSYSEDLDYGDLKYAYLKEKYNL